MIAAPISLARRIRGSAKEHMVNIDELAEIKASLHYLIDSALVTGSHKEQGGREFVDIHIRFRMASLDPLVLHRKP